MTTAAQAVYGEAIEAAISAHYTLRLPYGQGGARLYTLLPLAGSLNAILPAATAMREGADLYTVFNVGGVTLTVKAQDGSTTVATLTAGTGCTLSLLDNSTANGTWHSTAHATIGIGTGLTNDRTPYRIDITQSGTVPINLRTMLDRQGYVGDEPVALTVEVADGVFRGAPIGSAAIDTGVLFPGSTILMVNRGFVSGYGGAGGAGGLTGSGAGTAGSNGGDALVARHSVSVVNWGTFAGGGGGGGGGTGASAAGGGGGGGGAGSGPGAGGLAVSSGTNGLGGAQLAGGGGGAGGPSASAGGGGGSIGSNGTAGSGGSGGAAGTAGYCLRAIGTGVVITKVRAGTLYGSEDLS